MKKTKSRPLRRRAAAAPLHTPWIRRSPSADGKSTVLGFKKPPPCSALAIAISHHIRAIKIFNARSRHLAIFGEGRPDSTTLTDFNPTQRCYTYGKQLTEKILRDYVHA
jgi:hypothetical protein